ncbi:putative ABC-type nitrate/sulfonate/bicarbonate transport system, permease component [Methanocella conradii HZ254]|uniref:ABC-type nitrate/sulfonate/bicarbonate transport system, permease component n=2 Tax=Methanocella TaxID=570266 RepID=H8I8T6_METCZ|nr:putative ABC-type nitrate/sulfonate/bicarbonate transport system, permease component [Methanocella conradii HZ254]
MRARKLLRPTNLFWMMMEYISVPRWSKVLLQISGLLFIILLWELVTGVFHVFKWIVLPPPTDVFLTMFSMALDGSLFINAGWSLLRVLLGFLVASAVAVPLGVAMGWLPELSYIVDPIVEVIRPIPPIAWIGLALLWFGIGINSAIFLVFIGAFFPILLNTIAGVRNVEKRLIEVAYTFGASDWEVLRKVVIPAASPTIFTGMRVGMGIGWMCVVAAEMIAVKFGLGNMILEGSNLLQTDVVMVGMITIGFMGLAINVVFQAVGSRLFRWQQGIGREVA